MYAKSMVGQWRKRKRNMLILESHPILSGRNWLPRKKSLRMMRALRPKNKAKPLIDPTLNQSLSVINFTLFHSFVFIRSTNFPCSNESPEGCNELPNIAPLCHCSTAALSLQQPWVATLYILHLPRIFDSFALSQLEKKRLITYHAPKPFPFCV